MCPPCPRTVSPLTPAQIPSAWGEGNPEAAADTLGEGNGLYSPVNSKHAAEEEPAQAAAAMRAEESPTEPLAPSLPRERSERGEGGSPERSEGETGGGLLRADNSEPALYSPVNSENDSATEPPPAGAASGGGISEPLYINPG